MAYFQITNFSKSFGALEVLKGIDLSVEKGEVVSLIGSSGSGKTTFLRCINFLEKPNTGKMMLDGEDLFDAENMQKETEATLREKRLNFGLVFQSFNLFPQYSALKNITLAPLSLLQTKLKEMKKSLKKQQKADKTLTAKAMKAQLSEYEKQKTQEIEREALELLQRVGLLEKKDAYPCQLSGGQCQRVAIARALALKPKILCFDEPTSALDPELTGEVLKVIKSLKNGDCTMLIVTHEMNFAKNVSDKVVFMAEGVVCEQGDPKQIFEQPQTEKLQNFLQHIEEDYDASQH